MRRKKLILMVSLTSLLTSLFLSCNAFDTLDNPISDRDKYAAAIAKANDGDCSGAKELLLEISNRTEDVKIALGWAYMCLGGATAGNIASSIYKYSGTSNDYTVLGNLARTMLPMDGPKLIALSDAVIIFSSITDSRKNIEVAIGKFAQAASLLAAQATLASNGSQLEKIDISTTCNDSCVTCNQPGMSDADITLFTQHISDAASELSTIGANDLKTLADAIRSGIIGSTQAARCFIYKNAIPAGQ